MRTCLTAFFCLLSLLLWPPANFADEPRTATELAKALSSLRQDETTYVRLRMEITPPGGGAKSSVQLQIKERRAKGSTDLVYQVLWPKERKGESVLLQKTRNRPATAVVFVPPDKTTSIQAARMDDPLLGSDLAYEDVIDDVFAWESQTLAGTETIAKTPCQILESKPGKGDRSSYTSVRSWVDAKRLVPLRIEKYQSGKLIRRIEATDVVKDGARYIPAKLTVHSPLKNSVTELDGSRIKHDLDYADREFTPDGLREVTTPRSSAE